jgi:transcriptional regulator with XRE-family HTH domain
MEVNEVFADRLKQLREVAGLSQTALAEKLGVSRGSISFYENGERIPDIVFLDKAAMFFGVPLDYLMGYVKNKKSENIDMGLQLGLSDQAIYNLTEAYYSTELLSMMIEDEQFAELMGCLSSYVYAKRERDTSTYIQQDDAPLEIDYNTFLMGEYFKSIAKGIRSKIRGAAILAREGIDPGDEKAVKEYLDRIFERSKAASDAFDRYIAEDNARIEREILENPERQEDRKMRERIYNFYKSQQDLTDEIEQSYGE